jgi:3-oxoacyl-[acyl-carrier-protein] synthase-3
VIGTGSALPEKVLTNHDLERIVDTSDEWITTRTGIKERRIASERETLTDFTVPAARRALESAGLEADEIDLIICATVTPDQPIPAAACFLQAGLKTRSAACFDLQAGCTGFIYALSVAQQYVETGRARHALVVGAELLSKFLNWQDRTTCIIFADGAGGVVLSRVDEPFGILSSALAADGSMADFITIPAGGTREPISVAAIAGRRHLIHMRGNETYKIAVRRLTEISSRVLADGKVEARDLGLFVPHQANRRIITAVGERLGIRDDQVYVNIDRVGNTSSASIPIALDEAVRVGRLKREDTVLMSAFGAGLTWGSALMRWGS